MKIIKLDHLYANEIKSMFDNDSHFDNGLKNLLGLDFGAVDIGHRLIDNKLFVFEINTAPGITGTTLDNYAKAIYNYYRSL